MKKSLVGPIVKVAIVCLTIDSLSRERTDNQRVCAFHMRHGASFTCDCDPCWVAVTAGTDQADIMCKVKRSGKVVSEVRSRSWPVTHSDNSKQ
jgi:hypothetical protein